MSHQPDSISAGTQVVSRVEVRGTNNSLVVRRKLAMHLLRLVPVRTDPTSEATLREAPVSVRVEAHRDRLLAVKRGVCDARSAGRDRENTWRDLGSPLPCAEVGGRVQAPWHKELHHDFERALAETKLPERPECEAANRLLVKARRDMPKHE